MVSYQNYFKPTELLFRIIQGHFCLYLTIMETSVGSRHGNIAHHAHSNKQWMFSAPKLGAPKLSPKKSKYLHTLQVWALYNVYFHPQKGMQVCNGLGTKYAMAKIQIFLVILKHLTDLFPPHPSAWYYVSSKCFNSPWRTGPKDRDFPPDTYLLVRWVLGVMPCSPKRVTKTLASVPAPRTSPVTVTTS